MAEFILDPAHDLDVAFALASPNGFNDTTTFSAPGLRYLKNGTSIFITHFVSEQGAEISRAQAVNDYIEAYNLIQHVQQVLHFCATRPDEVPKKHRIKSEGKQDWSKFLTKVSKCMSAFPDFFKLAALRAVMGMVFSHLQVPKFQVDGFPTWCESEAQILHHTARRHLDAQYRPLINYPYHVLVALYQTLTKSYELDCILHLAPILDMSLVDMIPRPIAGVDKRTG